MVPDVNLKQIQRRVYMSYFQDGLWDILLGYFILSWGLMVLLDMVALGGGLFVSGYFLVWGLKRRFTYPRVGQAKISEERRQNIKMVILGVVVLLAGLAVLPIFFQGDPPDWLREYIMFLFGCMLALVVSIIAYWWKISRWYAYAALMVIGVAFHQWLGASLPLSFIVPGAIVMVFGLVILGRFLLSNPIPPKGEVNNDVN